MTGMEDRELLGRFASGALASAFSELVRRHVDHVYSSALRRVNGDHALAQDVTQTVFADLARQAGRIPADMPPGGWLHRHTGFVASKMIDRERRRRAREQEAARMNTHDSAAADTEWAATAPLLDAAMDELPASDRDALVLRFFEQRDFRSVGAVLGLSDDSAQKKVSRALDKLRAVLGRRGVVTAGGALASLLVVNAVHAAPAPLAAGVGTQALAEATTRGGTLGGALAGLGTAGRVKAAAAVAVLLVATAAGVKWVESRSVRDAALVEKPVVPVVVVKEPAPAPPPPAPVRPAVSQPATVPELVAAAAAEWRGGNQKVAATSRALGFLSRIPPAQVPEALDLAGKVNDVPTRILLFKHLLSLWAESEPMKALAWASRDVAVSQRADMCIGIMNAWSSHDAPAVQAYAGKMAAMTKPPDSESIIATVFRTIAQGSPADAFDRLGTLSTPSDRGQALRGMLETVATDADRETFLAAAAGLRDDELRLQARRAVVEQWVRRDAPAAAAWVEKTESEWERTRLMDSLGMVWLQSDPPRAAAWWAARAPGAETLVKIINVWAQQDPNAAGQWLATQPDGAGTDTARTTFARQVADLDPESALRWAETVSDAAARETTIDQVFSNWRSRNAAAASAFLGKSGWPAARVARLSERK